MSLPVEIGIHQSEKLERQIQQFNHCAEKSNRFLARDQFIENIPIVILDKEARKQTKKDIQESLKKRIELPGYIKVCVHLKIISFT